MTLDRPARGHRGLRVLPRPGRLLAVDPGRVRVGVAFTDPDQRVASGLDTIEAGATHEQTAERIGVLVTAHDIVGVVMGWPRALDGSDGEAAEDAAALAAVVQEHAGRPVLLWDERFSTVEAERVMLAADASRAERRQQIDRVAATLLLQTVLDARRNDTRHVPRSST